MKSIRIKLLVLVVFVFVTLLAGCTRSIASPSSPQDDYPNKPITIIVPFSPGGSVDRMARGVASFMQQKLNVAVVVENLEGSGGMVGHTLFLATEPDGYTFLIASEPPYITSNILLSGASFKLEDFDFINAQWSDEIAFLTHKDNPYKTLGDLVDTIKANPGTIAMGVTMGSSGHVAGFALLDVLGIKDMVNIVTYDGGGPLRTALLGKHVDFSPVQMEGSDVIADSMTGLALWSNTPSTNKLWSDMPLLNDELKKFGYDVEMPIVSGSCRTLVALPAFKEKYPQRYSLFVDAYKSMLEDDDAINWFKNAGMPTDWKGPEETTKLVYDNHEVFSRYYDLLNR